MISFVGAGPGDLELITAKGVRLLQQADVVIYDRLVNPLLLYHCKKECRFLYAGKTPYKKSMTQAEICGLLQQQDPSEAIVRLKGGDPAIFGRLSEEIAAVTAFGHAFEVVPGITAASGVAAYQGMSLTERHRAPGVLFLTGHAAENDTPVYPFLDPEQTICLYMGVQALPAFLRHLLAQGFTEQTPVMIVSWGTTGFAADVSGTIATIEGELAKSTVRNPAMIIIGQIILSQPDRAWFSQLPDFGRTIKVVATRKPLMTELIRYTEQGIALWWQQVGADRDRRFDEVGRYYEQDHSFSETVFLDAKAETEYLDK